MPPSTPDQSRRSGWRLILEATKPHKGQVIVGVIAGLVWTLCKVSVPTLVREAIDRGITPKHHGTHALLMWSLIIVGVGMVSACCVGVRRYLAFGTAWRTETELRQRLFAHLQRLHFAFHDQSQTGQLMARANTDIMQVEQAVILIPLTAASCLTMVGVLAIMLTKDPILALLALGALPFLNIAATRFSNRIAPVNLALQQELADVSGVVEESLSGVRVVKGFGAERMQVQRLEAEAGSVLDQALKAAKLRAGFIPLIDFLPTLSMVAILWYGGHQVLDGNLEVGDILAFNLYILMLIWPLRMVGLLISQASRASAGAGRVDEILITDPEIVDRPDAAAMPKGGGGEVRLDRVHFGYGSTRSVLNGI
ncbi:MAG: ABC transporter ATP-binding protein, partial [Actinobacteria bacterium]|nr:ABC transporter ATP-binding protein [Actinomycetota bacterium]